MDQETEISIKISPAKMSLHSHNFTGKFYQIFRAEILKNPEESLSGNTEIGNTYNLLCEVRITCMQMPKIPEEKILENQIH